MMTIIFCIALIWLIWKMIFLGIKVTWGVAKILCFVILLPALLIGLVCVGLIYIALPILVVAGIVVLVRGIAEG